MGVFDVQVNQQRGNEKQSGTNHRPGELQQRMRGLVVMNLAIQYQERAAVKEKQRETQEEQHTLKGSLSAVAKDHHHPKERQQGSSGKDKERKKDFETQSKSPRGFYSGAGSTAIAKCKIFLAACNIL